jgi:hypothetical protein
MEIMGAVREVRLMLEVVEKMGGNYYDRNFSNGMDIGEGKYIP